MLHDHPPAIMLEDERKDYYCALLMTKIGSFLKSSCENMGKAFGA
jgi:hypothetical protein